MRPESYRGSASPVLIAIVVAAVCIFAAFCCSAVHAREFFPRLNDAVRAAHGRSIAWICSGEAKLYYVGTKGELHCARDRPHTPSKQREAKPETAKGSMTPLEATRAKRALVGIITTWNMIAEAQWGHGPQMPALSFDERWRLSDGPSTGEFLQPRTFQVADATAW